MEEVERDVLGEQASKLIDVALKIILNAGDARLKIHEAVELVKKLDYDQAAARMEEAKEFLRIAHVSQTEIIQDEARGIGYPHSLMFNHAQDTLMTINSEYNMASDMIGLFKVLIEKINGKEE